jgi:hypothetical protein
MYIGVKGAASPPQSTMIVPTDPPNFTKCVADARKGLPSAANQSDSQLRAECAALFRSLESQVMDFLIRADWHSAEGRDRHITVTSKEVMRAFAQYKREAYPKPGAFERFLKESGQTISDVLFRVRVNLIYQRLIAQFQARLKLGPNAAQSAVDRAAREHWRPLTYCQKSYTTFDCAHTFGAP